MFCWTKTLKKILAVKCDEHDTDTDVLELGPLICSITISCIVCLMGEKIDVTSIEFYNEIE